MKCPYCNEEMEMGYISSRDLLCWTKKKPILSALSCLQKNAMPLSLSSSSHIVAYNCMKCKKIIIDYTEDGQNC